MSFSRLQKGVTYLLAGLGLLSLTFGGEIPWLALVALFVGFIASWFAEGPLLSSKWWSPGITAFIALALVAQIGRGVAEGGGWLGLAMEFSGLLSISRLANRRNAADYQQIAILAFIQLIAATVLTTDFGYAGVFVAFAVVTPWVLIFAHLRREIERNYPVTADVPGGNDVARVLASRRIVDPSFLLWTALLSLPMLFMTVLLFAFFPRIGLGMLNFGVSRGQHVSGFGSDVELGGFGLIRDDPTVVVRVSTPGNKGEPMNEVAARRILRLRGTAFDLYDGRKWTRSPGEPVKLSPMGEYYPIKRMERARDLTLKLVLDRLDEPVIFVPTGAVGLRVAQRGLPGTPRDQLTLSRGHGFDIRYASQDEIGVVYEAVVSTAASDADVPVDREFDDHRYLELPAGHERVIALAEQVSAGIVEPLAKARRLEHYLRNEGRYVYSLDQFDTRGQVPLVAFLFDAKRGHCEYFSSALAIMLRGVGIPARNVTGFAGGEYNSYGGYYAIRQADAHSWVEALIPGRGWVTLDPTPGSRDSFRTSDLFRELRAMADAMRAYWMTRVVGYDLRAQVRAVRQLRDFFRSFGWTIDKHNDASEREDERPRRSLGSLPVAYVGLALGLAALLVWLFRRRKKRALVRLSASAQRAQRLYRELERTLAKSGHARPLHVTPEAHARALSEAGFRSAAAVTQLTSAYVQTRYGEHALPPAQLDELEQLLRDLKQDVKRAA
ncbi:MAG: Transglutaminase-like enzyme [Myxococcaceae bacterium]|nr:Transglutaminase-like enzyme [Myxococcaceae bacterium]